MQFANPRLPIPSSPSENRTTFKSLQFSNAFALIFLTDGSIFACTTSLGTCCWPPVYRKTLFSIKEFGLGFLSLTLDGFSASFGMPFAPSVFFSDTASTCAPFTLSLFSTVFALGMAPSLMATIEEGIATECNFPQFEKVCGLISRSPSFNVTFFKSSQYRKASFPRCLTVDGRLTLSSLGQHLKAPALIASSPSFIATIFNSLHFLNALKPIIRVDDGSQTCSRESHPSNAPRPISTRPSANSTCFSILQFWK
mmetsp:Transcript_18781/g.46524  ORF Transcript_18781/g.46524 Transcript_18781/m.46524 type:complete len:254 (+) Transcript_18781:1253-2014(+)